MAANTPTLTEAASGVVATGLQATQAYDRTDLSARLEAARRRLANPDLAVLVVGEFKQGKSSLINSLLGVPVCPVDDDVATAVPTVVRYGEPVGAHAVLEAENGDETTTEPIDVNRLADWVSEAGNPGNYKGLRTAEVRLPSSLLEPGLTLVDTPGVGGLDSVHGVITMGALSMAEAVVFVSDTSQELSALELDFLRHAHEACPNAVFAQTKIDLYPAWRDIVDRNKQHLAGADLDLPIFGVASPLRQEATRLNDRDLNEESGYVPLVQFLKQDVLSAADRIAAKAAQADLRFVTQQLASQFEAERVALEDPDESKRLVEDLEAAKEKANELRSRTARWQQTLGDAMQDVNADIDHDLRERTRRLVEEIDEHLEEHDPADIWEEFEPWLRQRVTAELVANYQELAKRAEQVAGEVAEHFVMDEVAASLELGVHTPQSLLDQLADPADLDLEEQPGKGENALTAMKGSYGGMLMITMVGNIVGLGVFAPLTLALGVGLGRKAMKDEKKRQLALRKQQGKTIARKFVDEAVFQVGKDSRDTLRVLHRQLRDHFTTRAEELQQSTNEALGAANRALNSSETERKTRLADVQAELGRIAQLDAQIDALGRP